MTLYEKSMARGGSVPGLDPSKASHRVEKNKAERCFSAFNGMATAAERLVLLPPIEGAQADVGERRRIVSRLEKLVIAKLRASYNEVRSLTCGQGRAVAQH